MSWRGIPELQTRSAVGLTQRGHRRKKQKLALAEAEIRSQVWVTVKVYTLKQNSCRILQPALRCILQLLDWVGGVRGGLAAPLKGEFKGRILGKSFPGKISL